MSPRTKPATPLLPVALVGCFAIYFDASNQRGTPILASGARYSLLIHKRITPHLASAAGALVVAPAGIDILLPSRYPPPDGRVV